MAEFVERLARVEEDLADVVALRTEVARLGGVVRQLLEARDRGHGLPLPATLESEALRARLDAAVEERLVQARESHERGEGRRIENEGTWSQAVRASMRAKALAGDLSEIEAAEKDRGARAKRARERAEAPARLEVALAEIEAEKLAVRERERSKIAGNGARR